MKKRPDLWVSITADGKEVYKDTSMSRTVMYRVIQELAMTHNDLDVKIRQESRIVNED